MKTALKNLIRPHYIQLQGYVSAGMEFPKHNDLVFLNANENPYALPGLEELNRYPQPQPAELLEAYAGLYDVKAENVVATRGADEAIAILTRLFCEPGRNSILICPPTFGMYIVDANAMPAGIIEVPLLKKNGTFSLDKTNIIAHGSEAKIVFICSPNNPTGTSFAHEEILEICKALQEKAVIVLDETYIEFSSRGSMASLLESIPNLIILRTLSKSYALAGMRMGVLLCGDPDFITLIRSKCLDAYPLAHGSIEAAMKVMTPALLKIAAENRTRLLKSKADLESSFQHSPLTRHIYPSDANFFLIEMDGAREFYQFCIENNLILRDFSTKAGTLDCLRISVGTEEENLKLVTLLGRFSQQRASASAA